MPQEPDYLEEYRALRGAIARSQEARSIVLGGVMGVLALILFPEPPAEVTLPHVLVALTATLAGLVLTRHYTMTIEMMGGYIRQFIETSSEGLRWETRWHAYRTIPGGKPSLRSRLMPGTSRVIVLLYLLLVVGILVLFAPGELNTFGVAIVVAMTLLNLIFIVDIWARLLPDWTVDWDRMKTAASGTTQPLRRPNG